MPEQDDDDYDYCNDEFPVLSFTYALYCDSRFGKISHETWLKSVKGNVPRDAPLTAAVLRKSGVYTAYLDDYTQDRKRIFPLGAIEFITVTVATNPPVKEGLYVPTTEQANDFVAKYLVPELTGRLQDKEEGTNHKTYTDKKKKTQGKRAKAVFDLNRPVLSCLALLLVNSHVDREFEVDPAAFLAKLKFPAEYEEEKGVLIAFVKSDKKHFAADQAKKLTSRLVAEITGEPFVW